MKRDDENKEIDVDKDLKVEHVNEKIMPKHYKNMRLAILNGNVASTPGGYVWVKIPIETARIFTNSMQVDSYVGHESTAKTLSKLLQRPVAYRRTELIQDLGQLCIAFTLKKRAPEGTILTVREVEEVGYNIFLGYRYT